MSSPKEYKLKGGHPPAGNEINHNFPRNGKG